MQSLWAIGDWQDETGARISQIIVEADGVSIQNGADERGNIKYDKLYYGEPKLLNYIQYCATISKQTDDYFHIQVELIAANNKYYLHYVLRYPSTVFNSDSGYEEAKAIYQFTPQPINSKTPYTEDFPSLVKVVKKPGTGYLDDSNIGKIKKTPSWLIDKWIPVEEDSESLITAYEFTENSAIAHITDSEYGYVKEEAKYGVKIRKTHPSGESADFIVDILTATNSVFVLRQTCISNGIVDYYYEKYIKVDENNCLKYNSEITTNKNQEPEYYSEIELCRESWFNDLDNPNNPNSPNNLKNKCLTFESDDFFSIISKGGSGGKTWDGKLYYTTDTNSNDWIEWGGNIIYSRQNDNGKHTLYIRGVGNGVITGCYDSRNRFIIKGNLVSCTGDIRTLLNYKDVENSKMSEYCFAYLFYGCDNLITAPTLPAKNLAYCCYKSMFNGCTSLTSAPALPATTLESECYKSMFNGCTSLTSAPALPATTLKSSCYQAMFSGCTSLTSAPALPATTLATECYQAMFSGCTSLTSAPALPAITLESYCYNSMFFKCTSLTSAPALPATTLADLCYTGMFYGCTSLTSAPALPAITLESSCYWNMFQGCTSLTSAPALPATTLAGGCYWSMFSDCTSLTSVPALHATTLESKCYCGMFSGCTSLTSAPALPATTLAAYCYQAMFYGCTSLTSAPALPATALAAECYQDMFEGCTSLKFSATKDESNGYINEYKLGGGSASDALTDMFAGTGGTFKGTPTSGQTLWTSNEIIYPEGHLTNE